MTSKYDVIIVGGGFGGACLACALARDGYDVLVLERERRFKDRVRGETTSPWGVADLIKLGCYDLIRTSCGRDMRWFDTFIGPVRVDHRDLVNETERKLPALNFFHPSMQTTLLAAAADLGAHVISGTRVTDVVPGSRPRVTVNREGGSQSFSARLVIGADGKESITRKRAGFVQQIDSIGLMITGTLLEGATIANENTNYWVVNPDLGQGAFLAPQNDGRLRAYLLHRKDAGHNLAGPKSFTKFKSELVNACVSPDWLASSNLAGPLATFDGSDTWVEHPYQSGVALIGDAASTTDPSYGQGLSLTARDDRVLRDALLNNDDWDEAGHAYANEHDRYRETLNTMIHWLWHLFYERGSVADGRRAVAFPELANDPSRMPDVLVSGPDMILDEIGRQRLFAEQ